MSYEKPAQGILKRNDYGNSMTYQVVCECGDSEHDHNLWVEADDYGVTVTIYTNVKSKWWDVSRWKKIWTLLTKGYVEYETSIIMKEQQVLNYAETLKEAAKQTKAFNNERKSRTKG